MFSKMFKLMFVLFLSCVFIFSSSLNTLAVSKQMWGAVEYKDGMIGKVTVLRDTPKYQKDSKGKLNIISTLKKGQELGVYGITRSHYGLGGDTYVQKAATSYTVLATETLKQIKNPANRVIIGGLKPNTKKKYTYRTNGTKESERVWKYDGVDYQYGWDRWSLVTDPYTRTYYSENGKYMAQSHYRSNLEHIPTPGSASMFIQLPLKINQTWGAFYQDPEMPDTSYKVTSVTKTIKTPAGTFNNVIEIKKEFSGYWEGYTESYIYVAEGVGVIRISSKYEPRSDYGASPRSSQYELYKLQ
ncbi:hypothetical protein [Priestia abyssalis]|uniref:hypothetical protein n=1 Tax=Priestia abyssalis TaxID=1221450 RepID=UPI000995BCE7|nr:hypothetical protein [Priestia abyssalis]